MAGVFQAFLCSLRVCCKPLHIVFAVTGDLSDAKSKGNFSERIY